MSTTTTPPSDQQDEQTMRPLSPAQQFERLLLIVALAGLILTGLPQKFSLEGWANFTITMLGGIESTRLLHRFFAALLTAEVIFHVVMIAYQWFVLRQRPRLFPGLRDWRKLFTSIFAGFSSGKASDTGGQFSLKFEYLILFVSIVILGVTGAILLNPILISDIFPGSTIPIAQSVHSDHALLFTIVIIIWRIGVFLVWRPKRTETASEGIGTPPQFGDRRRTFTIVAGVVVIVVGVFLFQYATYETTAIDTVARIDEVLVFSPQFMPEEGDPDIGALVWSTQRCAFCHGENAEGGIEGAPALPTQNLTFDAFVVQVREGDNQMPAFTKVELPDSYLVHLWAWITEE